MTNASALSLPSEVLLVAAQGRSGSLLDATPKEDAGEGLVDGTKAEGEREGAKVAANLCTVVAKQQVMPRQHAAKAVQRRNAPPRRT